MEMGSHQSPFPYGDSHIETGSQKIKSPFPNGDYHMETGVHFVSNPYVATDGPHMETGTRKSPFPCRDSHMKTGS